MRKACQQLKFPPLDELIIPILEGSVVRLGKISDYTGYLFPEKLELVKSASQGTDKLSHQKLVESGDEYLQTPSIPARCRFLCCLALLSL